MARELGILAVEMVDGRAAFDLLDTPLGAKQLDLLLEETRIPEDAHERVPDAALEVVGTPRAGTTAGGSANKPIAAGAPIDPPAMGREPVQPPSTGPAPEETLEQVGPMAWSAGAMGGVPGQLLARGLLQSGSNNRRDRDRDPVALRPESLACAGASGAGTRDPCAPVEVGGAGVQGVREDPPDRRLGPAGATRGAKPQRVQLVDDAAERALLIDQPAVDHPDGGGGVRVTRPRVVHFS